MTSVNLLSPTIRQGSHACQWPRKRLSSNICQSLRPQTVQSIEIVSSVLEELGLSLRDVVRNTVYLQSMKDFARMNSVYEKLFPKPYPVRSSVQFVLPFDALVAIEATAYLKQE